VRVTPELGYFTLPVADLQKAEAFYGAVFGWSIDPASSHPQYAHVGNTKLPFGFTAHKTNEPPADLSNFYIRVPDLDAVSAKVTAAGGSVGPVSESPSGLHAMLTDNQGLRLGLWQPAPGL
jgi:uncharacterized protein